MLTIGKHIDDLGTRRLSWRDLKVIVTYRAPDGALSRAMDPKGALWSPDTHLLANVTDLLSIQVWAQSKKGTKKPEPTWRPNQAPKKKGRNLTQIARNGGTGGR